MAAQFGPWTTIVQRGKAGGTQWHLQSDTVFASEEDMGNILWRAGDPLDTEPFPKQRLAWIGYLNPGDVRIIWVVEVGIKK
jgi:hypothetical protein